MNMKIAVLRSFWNLDALVVPNVTCKHLVQLYFGLFLLRFLAVFKTFKEIITDYKLKVLSEEEALSVHDRLFSLSQKNL